MWTQLRRARGKRWLQLLVVAALAIGVLLQAAAGALGVAAAGDYLVYGDGLAGGWANWSFSTTVNTGATSPVRSGSKSIAFTYNSAWAGLYLHTNGMTTSGYSNLQFYLNGGSSSGQQVYVVLYDAGGNRKSTGQPVNSYVEGGSIAAGQWRKVSIPLASLGGANQTITGVLIQDLAGRAQPTIYLDDMVFTGDTAVAPAPTSTPVPTSAPAPTSTPAPASTPPPTSTPVPTTAPATTSSSSGATVYGDALAGGWQNWSWSTTANFSATSPLYSGSKSLAFTYNAAWAGLYLHTGGLNTSGYSALRFFVHGGGASGQLASVALYGATGNKLSAGLPLNNYISGGSIAAGEWRTVSIPLSSLNGANTTITGILIQDAAGRAQNTIYLDVMELTNSVTTTSAPAPTPTATPQPAPAQLPVTTSSGSISGSQPYTGVTNHPYEYLESKGALQWLGMIKFAVADAVRVGLLRADEVPLWQNVLLGQIGIESVGRNFALGAATSQWYSQGLTQQVFANHYKEEPPYDPMTNLRTNLRTVVRYYRQHDNRWDWAVAQHVTGQSDETKAKTVADWNSTTGLDYAMRTVNVAWWANRLLSGGDVFPSNYYSFQLTGNGGFDKAPLWDIFYSPNLAFNWKAPSNSTAGYYQSLGADSKIGQPISKSTWMAVPDWFYTTTPGGNIPAYQPPAATSTQASQYPAGSTVNAPWAETYPRQQWSPPAGTVRENYYGSLAP